MSPDANPVAPTWKTRLQNWADADPLQQHEAKILLALTPVIGAVVGLVVVGFLLARRSEWIQPAAGGVLVGLMAWLVPVEARGVLSCCGLGERRCPSGPALIGKMV